jgi:hypothetical protein
VSPISTRSELLAAIDGERQAGPDGRIVLKTNGLTDPGIIDALYRAAQAGASVDLIVRGRCCLRAGVPGLSEGIRVRSLVGRYLEHSRIFLFGGVGGRPGRVWIGSPDLMERNLDRRVEVMVPIDDPDLGDRLASILSEALADQANSWELQPDGRWSRVAPGPGPLGHDLQRELQTEALASVRRRRDSSPQVPAVVRASPRPVPGDVVSPQPEPTQAVPTDTAATRPVPREEAIGVPTPAPAAEVAPAPAQSAAQAEAPAQSPRWWQRLFRRGR